MNEYTYKAKKIEDGEWTQGSLFAGINNAVIMQNIRMNPDDECEFNVTGNRVDKDTICRYTGDGLWEHDIIRYENEIGVIKYGVHENDYGFYVEWKTKNTLSFRQDLIYWLNMENVMLVGNDIDNPIEEVLECLKQEE